MLDESLEEAIHDACKEAGQDDVLAVRILAWLNALSADEPEPREKARFLKNVLEAVRVDEEGVDA